MTSIGWGRWSFENGYGGAWKMGTVELGKWRWWSLENGIGGAWKMETVELGVSMGSLIDPALATAVRISSLGMSSIGWTLCPY